MSKISFLRWFIQKHIWWSHRLTKRRCSCLCFRTQPLFLQSPLVTPAAWKLPTSPLKQWLFPFLCGRVCELYPRMWIIQGGSVWWACVSPAGAREVGTGETLETGAARTGGQVRVSLLRWTDARRNVWVGKKNRRSWRDFHHLPVSPAPGPGRKCGAKWHDEGGSATLNHSLLHPSIRLTAPATRAERWMGGGAEQEAFNALSIHERECYCRERPYRLKSNPHYLLKVLCYCPAADSLYAKRLLQNESVCGAARQTGESTVPAQLTWTLLVLIFPRSSTHSFIIHSLFKTIRWGGLRRSGKWDKRKYMQWGPK